MNIIEKLREIILDAGIEKPISKETNFVNDLGFDSLDMVDMVFKIEDIFEFSIRDADIKNMNTVGEIANYIEMKMS